MNTLNKLRNKENASLEEPMNTLKTLKDKNATQLEGVTEFIETITHQLPDEIPIGHPLRQQKMLTFKQYVQAKGLLHKDHHALPEDMTDRQIHDFLMIAERASNAR